MRCAKCGIDAVRLAVSARPGALSCGHGRCSSFTAMLAGHVLLLVLLSADRADATPSRAQAELDACAERIEEMKARRERGAELDRLLRRAQDLAAELERTSADTPPLQPDGPSAEEYRERADAARDEADRLAAEIAALDVKVQDARRSHGDGDPALQKAALGAAATATSGGDRARVLQAQRAELVERRARAAAEAGRLEAQARAIEAQR
jgi:hypothetical protein